VVAIGDVYADGAPVRGFGAYMLSKAALHQAVRQMAVEMAPRVRVNAVLPGVVAWPEAIDASQREAILARVPLGRVGEPMDVARTVRFLCAEAPYITGAAIPVDGGRSLR
jgi:pteridine reductase